MLTGRCRKACGYFLKYKKRILIELIIFNITIVFELKTLFDLTWHVLFIMQ